MRPFYYTSSILLIFLFFITPVFGQGPDCVEALVICTDGAQVFNPTGAGINDFANPNNDNGCLLSLEDQSAWYYFEFQNDMPPNSLIEFSLNPDGGFGEDYDFAIYGPNVDCDNLGSPIRCSYASSACGFCPQTGLGMGATDNSEGAGGDGFVAPLVVNPGQGFFLLVDNWLGSSTGFSLSWGGSAAPFLNCNANPTCEMELIMPPDQTACAGGLPTTLFPVVTGNTGAVFYSWSSPNGLSFLDNPSSPTPTITIPDGTPPGTYVYTLTVTDDLCDVSGTVTINVTTAIPPVIVGNPYFCTGSATTLSATGNYTGYMWSNGAMTPEVVIDLPGTYTVTVTDNNGCLAEASITVTEQPAPAPFVTGEMAMCPEGTATFAVFSPGSTGFQWSNGETTPEITVNVPGPYFVTVTDALGCEGVANWVVSLNESPVVTISGEQFICPGETTTLTVDGFFESYFWSTNEDSQSITVTADGDYSVTVVDANGCIGAATFSVFSVPPPVPIITGATAICTGESTALDAGAGFDAYLWQDGTTDQLLIVDEGGTYNVTVTTIDGCTGTAEVEVTETPINTPIITGDSSLCINTAGQLSASTGFSTYLWNNGETTSTIDIDTSGTYSLTVTNAAGCEAIAAIDVLENPDPTPTITGNLSICDDESAILNAGDGYVSYNWSNGATDQEITVSVEGIFSVTVVDSNGCEGSTTHEVSINDNPEPIITGLTQICPGDTTTLDAGAYANYLWSDGSNDPFIQINTPGDVSVTVVDNNGCQGTTNTTVVELPTPTPAISGTLAYCAGDSTLLTVDSYPTYLWSDGSTDQNLSVQVPGQYTVTVTAANGCEGTDSVDVLENELPVVAISGQLDFCAGDTTVLDAGAGFDTYLWNDGSSGQTIIADTVGTYAVTVTDGNGCSNTDMVTTNINALPEPSIDGMLSFCDGDSTLLEAMPGFASYLWDDGSQTPSIIVDATNTYGLTVTDANGCIGNTSVDVEEYALPAPVIGGVPSLCDGESTTLNTVDNYNNYVWSTNSTDASILVDVPGIYGVTVTDANGCQGETSLDVQFNTLPVVTITGIDQFCDGASSTLDAGAGFAAYQWSDGSTGATLDVTTAGTYSVTATDANGCQNEDAITITVDPSPQPTIDGVLGFCEDISSTLTATGGFTAYLWEDGSTNPTLEVNTTGTYGLTVTDANGCQGSTSVDVTAFPLPEPVIGGVPSLCDGESTTLDVGGGYVAYLWSTASTNPTILVETPAVYGVTVTDTNGCQGETSLNVPFNPLPTVTISGIDQFCADDSSILSAGTGFADYQWSDGSSNATLEVTTAGTYSVTATDINGCQNEDAITITVDPLPVPVIDGILAFCADTSSVLSTNSNYPSYTWSDGSANSILEVNTSGNYGVTVTDTNGCQGQTAVDIQVFDLPAPAIAGETQFCEGTSTTLSATPGFDYLWSTNAQTQDIVVDMPGAISVTVTDTNGCQGEADIDIQENPLPVVAIAGIEAFCNGASATLDAGSGFASYLWSDGSAASTLSVDTENTYSVTVTDDNGCQNEDAIDITVYPLPQPIIDGTFAFCADTSSILTTNTPYNTYNWSDGSSNNTLQVDAPGNYGVTVTDTNGCQGQTAVDIQVFELPAPVISGETQFCEGTSTTLSATPGFDYLWSTNAQTQDIVVDMPGAITVTVTDTNGCQGEADIDIQENPLPVVAIAGIEAFCNGASATLDAGNGFASYLWSDGSAASTLSVDTENTYSVTVTDDNGCQNEDAIDITVYPLPQPIIDGTFAFCADTSSILTTNTPYNTYNWSDGSSNNTLQVDAPGNYGVTVTDTNGCQGQTAVDIQVFDLPAPVISGETQFCEGTSTTLSATPGFDYLWSTNAQTQDIVVDMPGAITVTVTDTNGCQGEADVDIQENPLPVVAIAGIEAFCNGASATLDAGNGFASYLWSDGSAASTLSVDTENTYSVTVTDDNGCQNEDAIDITVYPLPQPIIDGTFAFCADTSSILTTNAPYNTYSWSDGSSDNTLQVDAPGNYGVTVTDTNGCQGQTAVDIQVFDLPAPAIAGETQFCEGTSTTLSATPGFDYLWSTNAQTQDIVVDVPGMVSVTVTDANGCIAETAVDVIENPLPQPIISGTPSFCEGTSTTINANAGFSAYQWSTGSATTMITITSENTYTVTVTDTNGCVNTTSVFVEELPLPIFAISGQNYFCEDDQTVISVPGGFAGYNWSDGTQTPDLVVNAAGNYEVTVTNTFGCVNTSAIDIDEILLPIADAGAGDVITCAFPAITLGGANPTGSNYEYVWTGPGISPATMNQAAPVIEEPGTYTLTIIDTEYNCSSLPSTVDIDENTNLPVVVLQVLDTLDCATTTVTIDGTASSSGGNFSYQWYVGGNEIIPGETSSTLVVNSPGLYGLQIVDAENGCLASDDIPVVENTLYPIAEAGLPMHLDCNVTQVMLDASGSEAGGNIRYTWTTLDGNILSGADSTTPVIDQPGQYVLLVEDIENNCANLDTVTVTQDIEAPIAEAGTTRQLDCNTPEVTLDGTGSSVGSNFVYDWTLATDPGFSSAERILAVDQAGTYTIAVTNTTNGCTTTDEVIITEITAQPTGMILETDTPTCFGDNDGSVVVSVTEGGTPPFLYSINGGPYGNSAVFGGLEGGLYEVTVQDLTGCEYSTEIVLPDGNDLSLDLGDDHFINLGETATIEAQPSIPFTDINLISWNAADSLDCTIDCIAQTVRPFRTTNYTATVVDENGCVAEDEVTVFVDRPYDVFIPNAFSPNNDGNNDRLVVFAGDDVRKINYFQIFSRWGEPVFEVYNFFPNDPTYGWDGTHRSREMNAAVFVYIVEVEFIDGEVVLFKGDVTLMR
jgi:gliding motility-associated-like protein